MCIIKLYNLPSKTYCNYFQKKGKLYVINFLKT